MRGGHERKRRLRAHRVDLEESCRGRDSTKQRSFSFRIPPFTRRIRQTADERTSQGNRNHTLGRNDKMSISASNHPDLSDRRIFGAVSERDQTKDRPLLMSSFRGRSQALPRMKRSALNYQCG